MALVSPYDWEVPGGVQAQVSGLAAALSSAGCTVVVAAPGAPHHHPPAADYELVPLGHSVRISVNGSVAPVAPTPAAVARCLHLLNRRHPDVVHVHEPLTPGPALAAASLGPRPIVATFHRADADALYRTAGKALRGIAGRIAVMAAVSEAARDTAIDVLGERARDMTIVPNGIDVNGAPREAFEAAAARADTRTPPTLTFVGRHEERKGLGVLLEALSQLDVDLELNVVGDGPQSAELRRRFAGDRRIHWLGAVSDEARGRVLAATDLFVAPSLGGESFGVVLLEAMASGAPVLASDLPGYRLAVGDGGAAHLVPPGDPAALATAIGTLVGDPDERQRLRKAGRKRAETFSMDTIAARYLELYEAAGLRTRRGGP